jgi:hypothetical protein
MAGTARTVRSSDGIDTQSELGEVRRQLNRLIAQFDALTAKLDADNGVQDTDYASTITTGATAAGQVNITA